MAKTYKTIQGDTWDLISFNLFGSELFSSDIMNANPDKMDFAVFDGGITLNIPSVTPLAEENINLPPWRRNV